jgi:hypothetical protein
MKLDVGITQGSYWKGGQIPYWLYMIFAILPITGLLGIDHFLLRSPITGILKLLSAVPLLGFWYFYDIAQVLGERELVEKYGIGVPFYGPLGIGAGIFTGVKDAPVSPPDIARPWKFIGYVLTSLIFIVFPINKLVIGDYWAALAQFIMYFLFPLTFLAIGWGFYDTYRILFDTRGVFEGGASRIPPASWILTPNSDRSSMGPFAPLPDDPSKDHWFGRLFRATAELPTTALKGTSKIIDSTTSATAAVISGTGDVYKASTAIPVSVINLTSGVIDAGKAVSVGLVKEAAREATDVMSTTVETGKEVIGRTGSIADAAIDGASGVIRESASAAEKGAALLGKIPQITEKIATGLADPKVLMAKAKQGASLPQAGGALLDMAPQMSTGILLFSVGLLAFGGYVAYTLRKTVTTSKEEDDSPPDTRDVRRTD